MQSNIHPFEAAPAVTAHHKYRADIDGLRAIAVLSVVLFHAFPRAVRGGFVGVDVFFVISGFLISSIIMGNLEQQKFSYADFYGRRIRRIFPALMLVMGSTLLLGWFALLSDEFRQLGKHAAAGAAFVSNFALWHESGYFDTSAEGKPLLHLWSLAIEEQFYIFWPVLLGLVWRRRLNFLTITLTIGILSFLFNIYILQTDRVAAFYSPLSRFWELMIGGVLAYLLIHRPATLSKNPNLQSVVGLLLLGAGLVFIDGDSAFPGWRALLPTVGAFLLISGGPQAWLNRHVLASKPMVWFGLISYPLYLWHWPMLSFAHIIEGSTPPPSVRGVAVVASIVAAYLTYRLLEVRFRNGQMLRVKNLSLVAVAVAALASGLAIFALDGVPSRAIMARNAGEAGAGIIYRPTFPAGVSGCDDVPGIEERVRPHCNKLITNPGGPVMAVWGDSSSHAWAYVFYRLAERHHINVYVISHSSCPPLLGVRKSFHHHAESYKYCSDARLGDEVIRSLKALSPRMVFLMGSWNGYTYYADETSLLNEYVTTSLTDGANKASSQAAVREQLPRTIEALDAFTRVVVFRSWPKLLEFPNYKVNRLSFIESTARTPLKPASQHRMESAFANSVIDELIASHRLKQTEFFDPSTKVCATWCNLSVGNVGMYDDEYHITPYGSSLFENELSALLQPALR